MTPDPDHQSPGELQRLAALEPDPARSARTHARCRAVLARQRAARTRRKTAATPGERAEVVRSRLSPIALVAFCLLCAAYVGELVVAAVRLLSR